MQGVSFFFQPGIIAAFLQTKKIKICIFKSRYKTAAILVIKMPVTYKNLLSCLS